MALGGETTLIRVGEVPMGEVASKGFTLTSACEIEISGAAAYVHKPYEKNKIYINQIFYGWIINSDTRQRVWHTLDQFGWQSEKIKGIRALDDRIQLPPGNYEIYYAAIANTYGSYIRKSFYERIMPKIKKQRPLDHERLFITVSAPKEKINPVETDTLIEKLTKDAVVSLRKIGDDADLKKGFSLVDKTRFRLYCIGEGVRREGSLYDYAWITVAETQQIVWGMEVRTARHAGGERKNISVDKIITLPKGNYEVHYQSDDSHSFESWNAPPPNDPSFWGVTLWPYSDEDRRHVAAYKPPKLVKPVLALNQIGNEKRVSKGIALSQPVALRVLCIGEGSDYSGLVDYGWIINADTRETVWTMAGRHTQHAGGADKNRMIDEKIKLPEGHYIVNYVTDDSHAFGKWNAGRPFNESSWGLTLWPSHEKDRKHVTLFNPDQYKSQLVLAEIKEIGNHKYKEVFFTLRRDSKLRVIAIGEGTESGMADYGWIENDDTGRIIWEMTYRKTDHGGGAKKNRLFNDIIMLPKGRYKVIFETDGSHAYPNWNATPPNDPKGYGIRVQYEE